ncbi:ceramidase domain-containing protein [Methylobacterium sp. J-070]|uniref:ceramidase domain-containing protein n=1 Tax=Methylobacterium sp. J-070 TaxID=2836650 RepID=UPI001FB9357F|nr:ceramidase domain-containing protein [Methylobacterium sp. J-070]MCJ2053533.1 ceramidase [Methylobacterium sp. J-070]
MDWFEPLRDYCERGGPEFWAEPANALSNAGFLLAAAAAARRASRAEPRDQACLALSGLIAVVGIGSFLFHTLAVYWSMLADVIPIALFIYGYLALALHRFLRLAPVRVAAATVGFVLFSFALTPMLDSLTGQDVANLTNGSIAYVPPLLALFGVAWAAAGRREERFVGTGRRLAVVGLVFLVSFVARTADHAACSIVPTGTHPLWHVLNAAVLYALLATAIRHRAIAG